MKQKLKHALLTISLGAASCLGASSVLAVGGGVPFNVNEALVFGAMNNAFPADSVDLTYHACDRIFTPAGTQDVIMRERGYFWVSSFQDAVGVVDSQLNHFAPNGYHIYGVYEFEALRVGAGPTALGNRRAYKVQNAQIDLYRDPLQNTTINLVNCQNAYANTADDRHIGSSTTFSAGEKSEKDGLANGDFDIVFTNWMWDQPAPIIPNAFMNSLEFNANVTTLGGPLDNNHTTEGSGNLFWLTD